MPSISLLQTLRPEVQADLNGFYDRLNEAEPCRWDRPLTAWVVTGHEAVSQAARDPRLSSVRYPDLDAVDEELRPVAAVLSRQMLYVDAPGHPRLRGLVAKAFTARAVDLLRTQIGVTVDTMLDGLLPRGEMDVVADLAHPLPVAVICDLLGVPPEDRSLMSRWSADVAVVIGNPHLSPEERDAAVRSMDDMLAYFGKLQGRPGGVFDALLTAQRDGADLTVDEAVANTILLFMAGQETTTHFLGNALRTLLLHPEQAGRLRADPGLWPAAIEELLRLDSPVQLILRRARHDLTLAGADIRAGQAVLVAIGAANHDPAVFPSPHTLDVGRDGARHVAFGHGPHFCLGAGLARIEGETALRALLTRLPNLRLTDAPPRWQRSLDFRGLTDLPVRWDAPAG